MKKQNKQIMLWIIGLLALVLVIIGGSLLSVINWSSSGATMTNVEKVGANIQLSQEYSDISHISYSPTKTIGGFSNLPIKYLQDSADRFCLELGYSYLSSEGPGSVSGSRTAKWEYGSWNDWYESGSQNYYSSITCLEHSLLGFYTSGNILYVAYQTIQDNNKFTLGNLTETLNGGTITYKLVFNSIEYDFTDDVLELEVPESSNIQLKVYLTGSTSATPQYEDIVSLTAEYIAPAVSGDSLSTLEQIVFSTTGSKGGSYSSNLATNLTSPLAIFGYVVALFVLLISGFAIKNKWS